MLSTARSQTLTEDVIQQLLGQIRNGTWKPGESLPSERSLIQQLGVSRPCVREALQALVALGVIEVRPGRRARVKGPTLQSIFDPAGMAGLMEGENLVHLWEVRVSLDVAAARLAAERIEPDQLARLEELLKTMARHAKSGFVAGYAEADLTFHQQLVDAGRNPVLVEVYGVIHRMIRLSVQTTGGLPGGMDRGVRGHTAILDALRSRDPAAAEKAIRAHLGDANRYRNALSGRPATGTERNSRQDEDPLANLRRLQPPRPSTGE